MKKKKFKGFTVTQPCGDGKTAISIENFIATYEIAINIMHHAQSTQKNFCQEDARRAKLTLYSIFEQTLKMQRQDLEKAGLVISTLEEIIAYDGSQRYEGDDEVSH
jgi:hypothetical protein